MEEPWTILQLAELAADALAAGQPAGPSSDAGPSGGVGPSGGDGPSAGAARANGRVRDVPNERLVRWYVTVGLVDPPLSRRGRVAQYGRRHLLQLVAVKRLQAEGRSLAEIQAELAGATDDALAAVAGIPDARPTAGVVPVAPARFWTRSAGGHELAGTDGSGERELAGSSAGGMGGPAGAGLGMGGPAGAGLGMGGPAGAGLGMGGPAGAGLGMAVAADGGGELAGTAVGARGAVGDGERGRLVHGVRLAAGVTLLLEGAAREPGPDDVDAILNSARALLAELAGRGLREPGAEHPADAPRQFHLE